MPSKTKIKDLGSKIKETNKKEKVKVLKTEAKTSKTITKSANLSVPVYGLNGVKKSSISLPENIFGAKVNVKLMAQAVRVYQVNQRQGTASTKSRGEINATKAKVWRQKGTGRARHGAKSAPIWVGGGVALGPKPRDFELKISKQMRKKSLVSALSLKFSEDKIKVVDVTGATGKTAEIVKMFQGLKVMDGKKHKIMFIPQGVEAKRAAKNIEGVEIFPAKLINTYAVLNSNNLVISREAISDLQKLFEEPAKDGESSN